MQTINNLKLVQTKHTLQWLRFITLAHLDINHTHIIIKVHILLDLNNQKLGQTNSLYLLKENK